MKTTGKVLIIGGAGAALIYGITKALDLSEKSEAGGKLTFNLDDVSIAEVLKSGPIPSGLKLNVRFSIKNPSTKQLGFENLYIKASLPDSKGTQYKIADTVPDPMGTVIPAGQVATRTIKLEVRFLDVIARSADIATYLMNRARGKAATRKALIEWTYRSEGFNLGDKKETSF